MKLFYQVLAPFWPLVSPVEDYEEEGAEILRVFDAHAPRAKTLLELGSGGGHVAFHIKKRFAMTLTDLSAEMLAVSSTLNPECEHVAGDMRALDLGRTFDIVFAHDALDYMLTEADLAAAIATASRHLNADGIAVFMPDAVKERFEPGTECGGNDDESGRGVRYLEWTVDIGPDDTRGVTHYSFLVREPNGAVQCHHEEHPFGVFPSATWTRLFEQAGFSVDVVEERTDDDRQPRLIFVGRKRAVA